MVPRLQMDIFWPFGTWNHDAMNHYSVTEEVFASEELDEKDAKQLDEKEDEKPLADENEDETMDDFIVNDEDEDEMMMMMLRKERSTVWKNWRMTMKMTDFGDNRED